jgi:hypothetical protein
MSFGNLICIAVLVCATNSSCLAAPYVYVPNEGSGSLSVIDGYGWPVYRGGPMFYADTVGAANVVAALEKHLPRLGEGFAIAPLLRQKAAEGKRFTD